jgi:6-pyruvoyltetrahydropterin/6-carboxytetrahydropterin synthase
MYQSTKTYGHEVGLSCAFRQWKADSHCHLLHGYAIAVKLVFEADSLDEKSWVMDFGGLKEVKQWLQDNFDHKLLVAKDDPMKDQILNLHRCGIADVVVVDRVGCESFAEMIYNYVEVWLTEKGCVRLVSVEVKEHGANSAIYNGRL